MSYKGLIAELPLGPDGLTGSKNLALVRPTQLLRARNLTLENFTLQKEGGTTLYTPSAVDSGAAIQGGWDWWPSSGVQRSVIFTANGKLLKDSGSGAYSTTLAAGLTAAGVVPVFVEGGKEAAANNRKLFVFTGVNAVQALSGDGATTAAITTPPTDWTGSSQPITGVNHEDRLWGAGNLNDPHRWYYSTTASHEAFSGGNSGTISVYPGEGEGILAGCSYKGFLITWKRPRGVYYVDTTSATTSEWKVKRITNTVGIDSPLAFVVLDNDVLFWWRGEIWMLSATADAGDVETKPLTSIAELGPFIRENTNAAEYDHVQAVYHGRKRKAYFAVPGAGHLVNTRRLVVDLNRADLPRFSFSDFMTTESIWLRKDANDVPQPVAGDDAGKVWLLDQDTRTHNSLGYSGEFQTPHTDLAYVDPALATKRKNGQFLELVFEPKGSWNLAVDVIWDGETVQTLSYEMGGGVAALGVTTTLDVDFFLSGDNVVTQRKRIVGSGRRFSIVGRNSGSGEDFSVAKAYLQFTAADER